MARTAVGIVETPGLVAHAVGVGEVADGLARRLEQRGQAVGERQPPHRGQVGLRGTQQVEAVGLRLGRRALVGQHVVVEAEGAEDAGRRPARRRTSGRR